YIHDPYPLHYYPEPYQWSEPGYKKKIQFFNDVSLKCKWAAFPSLLLKKWMSNYFSHFHEKSLIIPHQLNNISLKNSSQKLPSFFDHGKFSLLHAGNLMKQRSPFGLLDGFKLFL